MAGIMAARNLLAVRIPATGGSGSQLTAVCSRQEHRRLRVMILIRATAMNIRPDPRKKPFPTSESVLKANRLHANDRAMVIVLQSIQWLGISVTSKAWM